MIYGLFLIYIQLKNNLSKSSLISETLFRGKEIVENSGTGWDYQEIIRQFLHQLVKGFCPDNVNGAFIGFVRKKVGVEN